MDKSKMLLWYADNVLCIENTRLNASCKVTILGILLQYHEKGMQVTAEMKLWYKGIMEYCGISADMIGDNIKRLVKAQAATSRTETQREKDGKCKRAVYFAFTKEFLHNPGALFAEEQTNHGGKRISIKCPGCGDYHTLRERSTMTCTGCGTVIEELTKEQDIPNEMPPSILRDDIWEEYGI